MCISEFIPGEQVIVLACSDLHVLHRFCFEELLRFNKGNGVPTLCPYCREPVDERKFSKKTFKGFIEQELLRINLNQLGVKEIVVDVFPPIQ